MNPPAKSAPGHPLQRHCADANPAAAAADAVAPAAGAGVGYYNEKSIIRKLDRDL